MSCRATSNWNWLPDRATDFQNECETLYNFNKDQVDDVFWIKSLVKYQIISIKTLVEFKVKKLHVFTVKRKDHGRKKL